MRDDVLEETEGGRGTEFGVEVHEFAEQYARHGAGTPANSDQEHVRDFIDSLSGDLLVEEPVYLPLSVNDEQVILSGVADLIHIQPERVEVIDYKTVRTREREAEYRKQLSVYYHTVSAAYPERPISISVFYTDTGTTSTLEPHSKADLEELLGSSVE
jgi:ATP-dependent exoDNAse (exonuclease V) beta subunit